MFRVSYLARLREIQTVQRPSVAAEAIALPPHASDPFGSYRTETFWRELAPAGIPNWAEDLATLSIPDQWKSGLLKLDQVLPPVRFSDRQWFRLLSDARHVALDWAAAATVKGWSLHELFGRAPMFAPRLDLDGVAMLLEGREISSINESAIVIENVGRSAHRFVHKRIAGGKLLWECG